MAWQDVEVDLGGGRKGRVLWSVTVKQGGARITVPNAIIDALGWTQHTPLKLQVGTGDNSGTIRIAVDSKGPIHSTKPYANAKSLQFRLGLWQGMPRDHEQVAIPHEVLGGALILHLPAAPARVAQTEAAKPVVTVAEPVAVAATPVRAASIMSGPPPVKPAATGKIDVTSRFFDDPKKPPAMASGVRGARS